MVKIFVFRKIGQGVGPSQRSVEVHRAPERCEPVLLWEEAPPLSSYLQRNHQWNQSMNPDRKMLVSRGSESTGCSVSVRIHQLSGISVLGALMDSPLHAHHMKIIKSGGEEDPRHTQTDGPLTHLSFVFQSPRVLIQRERLLLTVFLCDCP